jgi:tetratricopeptide (TPR) repeat protein
MVIGIPRCAAVLSLLVLLSPHSSAQQAAGASRADDLMKRGLYQDAVRVLLEETKGQPEEQCGQKFLMLGESYYMLKQYAEARPYFAKALSHLKEDGPRLIAEYRLACVAYRLGDAAGVVEKIDAFVARFPTNERSGVLLVFKMKLLAARGNR